jgi:hypothetical protein
MQITPHVTSLTKLPSSLLMVHIRPNDGFMTQLLLYGEIEHDVNVNRTAYRRFLIASNAAQRESKCPPTVVFRNSFTAQETQVYI